MTRFMSLWTRSAVLEADEVLARVRRASRSFAGASRPHSRKVAPDRRNLLGKTHHEQRVPRDRPMDD